MGHIGMANDDEKWDTGVAVGEFDNGRRYYGVRPSRLVDIYADQEMCPAWSADDLGGFEAGEIG